MHNPKSENNGTHSMHESQKTHQTTVKSAKSASSKGKRSIRSFASKKQNKMNDFVVVGDASIDINFKVDKKGMRVVHRKLESPSLTQQ